MAITLKKGEMLWFVPEAETASIRTALEQGYVQVWPPVAEPEPEEEIEDASEVTAEDAPAPKTTRSKRAGK